MFTDTATIVDRRDVFADARISLDRMSKQFRQGETIDTAASDSQQVTMITYIDGVPTTVVWRVDGTSAPYALAGVARRRFHVQHRALVAQHARRLHVHGARGRDRPDHGRAQREDQDQFVDLISDIYLRNADV